MSEPSFDEAVAAIHRRELRKKFFPMWLICLFRGHRWQDCGDYFRCSRCGRLHEMEAFD